jgi:hypothetical protein
MNGKEQISNLKLNFKKMIRYITFLTIVISNYTFAQTYYLFPNRTTKLILKDSLLLEKHWKADVYDDTSYFTLSGDTIIVFDKTGKKENYFMLKKGNYLTSVGLSKKYYINDFYNCGLLYKRNTIFFIMRSYVFARNYKTRAKFEIYGELIARKKRLKIFNRHCLANIEPDLL